MEKFITRITMLIIQVR